MKYLLVVDETGNPIYYDHPDGPMLCPVLSSTWVHMKCNLDSICKALSCGKTRFVQHQYETLVFLLVSDQGEPDSVLRSQLHLVYQLILLLFGPTNLHQRRRALDKFKKTIQKLIDTTFNLLDTTQSVLVQSIELLEVNKDILNKCMTNLKGVVANCHGATHALLFVGTKLLAWYFRPKSFQLSSMDMFLLILFFRGVFHPTMREVHFTKLHVADYTDHEEVIREANRQGTAGSLIPSDTDIVSSVTTDDLHTGVGGDSGVEDLASDDGGFDTATEDWEDSFSMDPVTIDVAHPVMLLQSGWLDEIFDPQAPNPSTHDSSSSSSEIALNIAQNMRLETAQTILEALRSGLKEGQANEGVFVIQHALFVLGLTPLQVVDSGTFGPVTRQGVVAFQRQHSLHPTGEADTVTIATIIRQVRSTTTLSAEKLAQLEKSQKQEGLASKLERVKSEKLGRPTLPNRAARSSGTFSHPTSPVATPSSLRRTSNSNTPSESASTTPQSSRPPSRAEESASSTPHSDPPRKPATAHHTPSAEATVFEQLYLRIPTHLPMWVYCAELQEITTLVVISKGLSGTNEERERLDKSRDQMRSWLHKNYASYLLAKERTHLPILPHLPHLPGLVHYIFVDRTTNRVRAPTISPLHGQVNKDPVATERMLTKLRYEIQQLVHVAQEHLAQGFTSTLVRKHDFLYSYRLWVEDDEGVEQVIEQSIPTNDNLHRTPLGHRFYKELLRWLFPSQSQQMKCYELYTLYLGVLPAALVSKNDRALIAMLLERDVD